MKGFEVTNAPAYSTALLIAAALFYRTVSNFLSSQFKKKEKNIQPLKFSPKPQLNFQFRIH